MKSSQFIIILTVLVIAWASLFITALNQDNRIEYIISSHTSTINTVEQNQHTNAAAIKDYIACLLTLNPQATATQLQSAEQICFDNAPNIK